MARDGVSHDTEVVLLLHMSEHGLALVFVADCPIANIVHEMLEVVLDISHVEQHTMYHHTGVHAIGCHAHTRVIFLQCPGSEHSVHALPNSRVEESLAILACELHRVFVVLPCFWQHHHRGYHLFHAPCLALRVQARVANHMVLARLIAEILLHTDIHLMEQCRHLLALIPLLVGFRCHHCLLKCDRLFAQHDHSRIARREHTQR